MAELAKTRRTTGTGRVCIRCATPIRDPSRCHWPNTPSPASGRRRRPKRSACSGFLNPRHHPGSAVRTAARRCTQRPRYPPRRQDLRDVIDVPAGDAGADRSVPRGGYLLLGEYRQTQQPRHAQCQSLSVVVVNMMCIPIGIDLLFAYQRLSVVIVVIGWAQLVLLAFSALCTLRTEVNDWLPAPNKVRRIGASVNAESTLRPTLPCGLPAGQRLSSTMGNASERHHPRRNQWQSTPCTTFHQQRPVAAVDGEVVSRPAGSRTPPARGDGWQRWAAKRRRTVLRRLRRVPPSVRCVRSRVSRGVSVPEARREGDRRYRQRTARAGSADRRHQNPPARLDEAQAQALADGAHAFCPYFEGDPGQHRTHGDRRV